MNYCHVNGVEILQGGMNPPPSPWDCIVFDVDGVLVDATVSYPAAILDALHWFTSQVFSGDTSRLGLIGHKDIPRFKAAGGFNDEWNLAYAAALWIAWQALDPKAPSLKSYINAIQQAKGGLKTIHQLLTQAGVDQEVYAHCPKDSIMQLAQEFYGGTDACQELFGFMPRTVKDIGRHHLEHPLVSATQLDPFRAGLGIYTGRSANETLFVLKSFQLETLFPAHLRVTASSGITKPDPAGLNHVIQNLSHQGALFVGDTLDDWQTVLNHRLRWPAIPVFFAGITSGAMGPPSREIFAQAGVDLIAPSTQHLLYWLNSCKN